jgi:hypothetical protein
LKEKSHIAVQSQMLFTNLLGDSAQEWDMPALKTLLRSTKGAG